MTYRQKLIEVKGRHANADTLHITRNAWLVALNKRKIIVEALTLARDGSVIKPFHYLLAPLARTIS